MSNVCDLTVLMALNKVDDFTADAIDSVLAQSFVNFKFLIVCNGADAVNIAEWLSQKYNDERIKTMVTILPGLANALNFGLSTVTTKYLARMDADDISLAERFEEQINYLTTNSKVGVLGCGVVLIGESGETLPDKFMSFSTHRQIVRWLPVFNSMCHPALMFRTKCLQDVGGYKYGFHSEDHDLFIRIAKQSDWQFVNLQSVLFNYRRHTNQITSSGSLKIFAEVSGFLVINFLKSGNPIFLVGVIWVSPPFIWIKKIIRSIIRFF